MDDFLVKWGISDENDVSIVVSIGCGGNVNYVVFLFKDNVVVLFDGGGCYGVFIDVDFVFENIVEGVLVFREGLSDLFVGVDCEVEDLDGGVGKVFDGVDVVGLV